MEPALYFSVFLGVLAFFVIVSIFHKPEMRACPACGCDTPLQNRRCRHCRYLYGRE